MIFGLLSKAFLLTEEAFRLTKETALNIDTMKIIELINYLFLQNTEVIGKDERIAFPYEILQKEKIKIELLAGF
ncbi:MAG: hypothetical protein ACM3H8_09530 [Sphingobacteriales bacterium]